MPKISQVLQIICSKIQVSLTRLINKTWMEQTKKINNKILFSLLNFKITKVKLKIIVLMT